MPDYKEEAAKIAEEIAYYWSKKGKATTVGADKILDFAKKYHKEKLSNN